MRSAPAVASAHAADLRHRRARQGGVRRRAGPARWRCTSAARPSTTFPTSATAAPRSRSTSSGATCSGGATRSRYVSNITDIEDKIIRRAQERGTTESELVAHLRDGVLGAARPARRAAARRHAARHRLHRRRCRRSSRELIDAGRAYVIEGQGVYFEVSTLADYGALSHRRTEDLLEGAGARVEVDEEKRSPLDFALWKAAKPGEPEWPSPWGAGPTGLAHRMLGDVARDPRRGLRHPRRRRRPRLPPPRERARAGRGRGARVRRGTGSTRAW